MHKKEIFHSEKEIIFNLLDLYPEFFRYGISIIFKFLYEKKKTSDVRVYIYTNNTCIPISWTSIIISYIEERWKIPNIVDNIIRAFKIEDKIIEYRRTTKDKNFNDLAPM